MEFVQSEQRGTAKLSLMSKISGGSAAVSSLQRAVMWAVLASD